MWVVVVPGHVAVRSCARPVPRLCARRSDAPAETEVPVERSPSSVFGPVSVATPADRMRMAQMLSGVVPLSLELADTVLRSQGYHMLVPAVDPPAEAGEPAP